jgi:hypothetical protein
LKHCVDDGADPTCSPIRAGLRGLVVSSIVFDMYVVDTMDEVEELQDVPRSDVGAPCPLLLADEFSTVVSFMIRDADSRLRRR